MSTQEPNTGYGQPGRPATAGSYRPSSASSSKTQRVLACAICQQRKVKCDRNFPCANCIRSGVQCMGAPVTPRPRKRRFPERHLLDRLRHYEELLRRNRIEFEPLHGEQTDNSARPATESTCVEGSDREPGTAPDNVKLWDIKGISENVDDHPLNFWQALRRQGDCEDESDSSTEGEQKTTVVKMWDQLYQHREHFLFGFRVANPDLSPLHPSPGDIFRYWQIYLDNVNPLLNVTHAPSLQPRVAEAVGKLTGIAPELEAVMFGVYCVAVRSLSPSDCKAMLHTAKDDLLQSFQFGCQQALTNCGLLRTNSRLCLTAYYLYLVSMAFTTHPQTLYAMLGMAIRIACRIGMHDEASLAKCSPFEAEMRRRLWWNLVLFDARIGEMSEKGGASEPTLNPVWDCKPPLNISDTDLRPGTKAPLVASYRCTDAVFTVVRSRLSDYLRHADFFLDFTNPAIKPVARRKGASGDPNGDGLTALEAEIEEKYLRFCNPEHPVQLLTIGTTRTFFARCRLLRHLSGYPAPSSSSSSSSLPVPESRLDAATEHAIRMLAGDTLVAASRATAGYKWFMASYFPLPAYIQATQDISSRPLGPLVERAWRAMSENFAARMESELGHGVAPFAHLKRFVLQAWEACEKARARDGGHLETPRIVFNVKRLPVEVTPCACPPATGSSSAGEMDVGLGGFQEAQLEMFLGGFPGGMGSDPMLGVAESPDFGTVPPRSAMGGLNLGGYCWPSAGR